MSIFFCDTNCEINLNTFKSLNINLIKMPYTVNGEQIYYDLGENTNYKEFFDQMRKGADVKTQALNSYDYIEYFKKYMELGQDILYLSFSHKMSGTFSALESARQELKEQFPNQRIKVIDTSGISQAAGIIVNEAAKMHNSGASDEAIEEFVQDFKKRIKVYFTVDSLDYLKRGGRLSVVQAFLGTLLNIKPIITLKDGALISAEKCRGKKGALKRISAHMQEDNIDFSYPIFNLTADSDDNSAFNEMLKEQFPSADIRVQDVGPVIGCHCGPGTIGIIFVSKA